MTEFAYVGDELSLFAAARNWKQYLHRQLLPYTRGEVLEVGAGLGATTLALIHDGAARWVCLEPDPRLAAQLEERIRSGELPSRCEVVVGTLDGYFGDGFDAVLYIDVLEHIEADAAELTRAAARVRAGGHLIVLSPAHQWLYSPFDEAIGHFRRYTKAMLRGLTPDGMRLVRLRYLDSVGLLASAANRALLRSSMPNAAQIRLWDGAMVPLSRFADRLAGYRIGKSVLAVWQRAAGVDAANRSDR
jgi:SAM-dependent methyltransferase